jgi:hypothetical protein
MSSTEESVPQSVARSIFMKEITILKTNETVREELIVELKSTIHNGLKKQVICEEEIMRLKHNEKEYIHRNNILQRENEKLKIERGKMTDIADGNGWDIYPTDSEEEEEDVCDMLANQIEETMDVTQTPSGTFKYTKKEEEYDSDNEEHSHKCKTTECPNNAPDDQFMCGKCR